MKNIVNKLRFALLLGFLSIGLTVLAQDIANAEKMSISTLMFLDEMAGKISFDEPAPSLKGNDKIDNPNVRPYQRPIASPETVNGVKCISSFICITDESVISELESLGVIIECRFDNGIMTSLIPIDKIEDVAALEGVKGIEVSEVFYPTTDMARETTNADDVLSLSNDALTAGLLKEYDGSGVIVGVIDTGIDFQHIAFKDKDGNSRIVGVYCCTTSDNPNYNWTGSGTLPTTDKTDGEHGSHTSSIAAGSSVIVNGNNVTVTDNHANATYGGMAPGADLYLAGINTLYGTRISNAMQAMVNYAAAQGKPLVINNSYGSTSGPHLGIASYYGDIVNSYFGDDHPNNICVFSAGNEAGNADPVEGGGCHVYGQASSSSPLSTILRSARYSNSNNGYCYSGILANAWCRSTSVNSMTCRVMVIDIRTGSVLKRVTVTPTSSSGTTVSGLSDYYSGTLKAYKYTSNGRTGLRLTATEDMNSLSYDLSANYYTSNYTLAVQFYPANGSSVIDVWGGTYNYFTDYLTVNGYNWTNGSDDMSANDFANNLNTIVVGSYVSRTRSSSNSLGDISGFSSYATVEANPMGIQHPWITAPGEVIIAAYNHLYTSRTPSHVVVVDNDNYLYGMMSGTSMAAPCVTGIVALWLQAATECGKVLKLSDVKNIMKNTAIRDSWVTSGANATHFGNGKINALAGIQYILLGKSLSIHPTEVNIEDETNSNRSATVTVISDNLTGNLTTTASNHWNATLNQDNSELTVTYNGKALHQVGSAGVHSYADNLHAGVSADYLYTGPIYIMGNTSNWSANSGIEMTRNAETGIYTATFIAQNSGDGYAYVGFTKRLGGSSNDWSSIDNYRFGPVSIDQNWALYNQWADNRDVFCPLDTIGGQSSIQVPMGTWIVTIDSKNNMFKFSPGIISSSVSPNEGTLNFGMVYIGRTSTLTITITNDGNLPFTPILNGPSGAFSTDYVPVELAPGESVTIPITYAPEISGEENDTITVSDGVNTYIWTLSGTGVVINSTLISNTVMVPVYKTDIEVLTAYTMEQLENDTNHLLPENATNTDVNVKVSRSADITRYDIYHREGIKESEDNWATGEINRTVAYANVNQNTYIPFAKDEENLNNWVQQPSITFDGEEDDMWIHLNDFVTVQNTATWYVPVVVANGVVTTDNTYGAPIRPSYPGSMTASVNYDISTVRTDANNNNAQYLYMTAEVALHCEAPQVEDGANYHYECYKARAWRVWTPYVLGVGAGETIETLMGEVDITGAADDAVIGCKDFQLVNGQWSLDEPTFCIPAGTTPLFVSRFYYRRVANNANQTLNAGGGGGGGGGAGAPGDGPAPPGNHTGISNISVDKEVSSVTYVNSLGMTSNQPFEGVNIIVTRYTDGTTSTSKMIHR